jgi:serine/threonine protein kinase
MGISESSELQEKFQRFRVLGKVELYHFGEVELLYDECMHQEVVRADYEFLMNKEREEYFLNKLKQSNNKCPFLINIKKL